MQVPVPYSINNQQLWLSAERSIFWENQKSLIVSDLHLGKTGHFRKSGIPVPQGIYKEDLQRLINLLHYFKPERLLVVGDFFHSHANNELEWFQKWRSDFSNIEISLIKGNHDILKENWYKETNIELYKNELYIGDFLFTHERCEDHENKYIFCGHIHPGVLINGIGRQSLRFPCFYFSDKHCILPAFSKFTGMTTIHPKKNDILYGVVEDKLIRIK